MALDSINPTPAPAPPEAETAAPSEPQVSYPLSVGFWRAERNQRFWAIPLIGLVAKEIILIPHLLILWLLGYLLMLAQLVLWIPVLFTGHYPAWGYALTGGYLRWNTRVGAFMLGLTDEYPPFTFRSTREDGHEYLVQVRMDMPERHHRFWAIPVLGLAAKIIVLVPHVVILYFLGLVVGAAMLALWVPVLFNGRYPAWGYQLVGGTTRWSVRVMAFAYGLTDRYPPFSFD